MSEHDLANALLAASAFGAVLIAIAAAIILYRSQ